MVVPGGFGPPRKASKTPMLPLHHGTFKIVVPITTSANAAVVSVVSNFNLTSAVASNKDESD